MFVPVHFAAPLVSCKRTGTTPLLARAFLCLGCLVFPGIAAAQPGAALKTNPDANFPATFVDVTAASGIHFQHVSPHTSEKYTLEPMGSGVALFDYDNDGRLDIFFVNGATITDPSAPGTIPQKLGPKEWNRLYHQKPGGTFEDVTEKAGLQGVGYGMGVAVGDYDNDGYEDLYVTGYGTARLYHNRGDGTFEDVTLAAGVGAPGWSSGAAWVDLDNDGLLDLVVVRYLDWNFTEVSCGPIKQYCAPDNTPSFRTIAPLVYHNDGGGHFTEVSRKIGISKPGKGLGIAIADYSRDGHIDLVVANDAMSEFLYHNQGNGTFEEVGLLAGIALTSDGHAFSGMGVDFADYNNDGLPDVVIDDLALQSYALFENKGDGSFSYESFSTGVGNASMTHSGWGLHFLDYDNDGWKDLLVAQGHVTDSIQEQIPNLRYYEPMMLLRNTGKGFVEVSASSGSIFQQAMAGRGLAIGDLDNDGRLDAVVTTNDGPAYILHNETKTKNHWITLKLVGHKSNRDAIGAEVKVVTTKGPQYATVTTAGSYISSSDKRVHFGLGEEAQAQSIEIHWPSGIVQTLKNVAADQVLQIDEPGSPSTK